MITAYTNRDGLFHLSSDRPGETYNRRAEIKAAGGQWNGRYWLVTDEQRQQLGIEKMVRVNLVHGAHQQDSLVPESEAVVGKTVQHFCMWCDGRTGMTVESIPAT